MKVEAGRLWGWRERTLSERTPWAREKQDPWVWEEEDSLERKEQDSLWEREEEGWGGGGLLGFNRLLRACVREQEKTGDITPTSIRVKTLRMCGVSGESHWTPCERRKKEFRNLKMGGGWGGGGGVRTLWKDEKTIRKRENKDGEGI